MSEETEESMSQFRGQLLDLGPDDRQLQLVPIYALDERSKALSDKVQAPVFKGIALHQHCRNIPVVTEDGVELESRCDYVILDMPQVMQLKFLLNSIQSVDEDGNPVDE